MALFFLEQKKSQILATRAENLRTIRLIVFVLVKQEVSGPLVQIVSLDPIPAGANTDDMIKHPSQQVCLIVYIYKLSTQANTRRTLG